MSSIDWITQVPQTPKERARFERPEDQQCWNLGVCVFDVDPEARHSEDFPNAADVRAVQFEVPASEYDGRMDGHGIVEEIERGEGP
ncbi:MAG TPA: hypothetical protein PLA50_10120 [Bacteroidia bacterium]|nr:hypothetical protein [Bacteroidia bacterium]